jgi:hypothetical protein
MRYSADTHMVSWAGGEWDRILPLGRTTGRAHPASSATDAAMSAHWRSLTKANTLRARMLAVDVVASLHGGTIFPARSHHSLPRITATTTLIQFRELVKYNTSSTALNASSQYKPKIWKGWTVGLYVHAWLPEHAPCTAPHSR